MAEVDPGFEEMAKAMVCEGPIVTWDRYWDSAFKTTNRHWSHNRSLFKGMVSKAVEDAGVSCRDLLSIVRRLKMFLEQKRVVKSEVVAGLTEIFQNLLTEGSPGYPCKGEAYNDHDTDVNDLMKDLKTIDCAITGTLRERWKKANGHLASDLSHSSISHALRFIPKTGGRQENREALWEAAQRRRALDELRSRDDVVWKTAVDVVDEMFEPGNEKGAGKRAKEDFKKRQFVTTVIPDESLVAPVR
jgi:hypothetical protein